MTTAQPSQPAHAASRKTDGARDEAVARFCRELGDALSAGSVEAAEGVLRGALQSDLPAPVILSRVIGPAMYEVGRRWEECSLSVADEHLATAACHQLLAVVYEHLLVARARTLGCVLLAGVEGEQHSLGLRMAADVLEGAGYEVVYLGADVPSEALLASVTRFEPVLVGLTATSREAADTAAGLIAGLRAIDPELAIIVGGQGFDSPVPGAEIHHDVEGLSDAVRRLAPKSMKRRRRMPRPAAAATAVATTARPSHAAQFEATTASLAGLTRRHATDAYGLRLDAMQDALTGLWNRRAFDDRFRELLDDPASRPLSLLLVDLDGFKGINDEFGHQVGDAALQSVARVMSRAARSADFIARLGGDEFVMLVPRASPADAEALAGRIRATIASESSPHFTVSIGIKACTDNPRTSLLAADIGLYRAKSRGRDTVFVSA